MTQNSLQRAIPHPSIFVNESRERRTQDRKFYLCGSGGGGIGFLGGRLGLLGRGGLLGFGRGLLLLHGAGGLGGSLCYAS